MLKGVKNKFYNIIKLKIINFLINIKLFVLYALKNNLNASIRKKV